ncbi:hypothetical protein M3Y97_00703400 [Aphelenchoides bicaudatus]|nr:hypothetical protein M3Y97_00703400 [Aphelenchoides bicaudatus]
MESLRKFPVVDTQPGINGVAKDGEDEKDDRKENTTCNRAHDHSDRSDCCRDECCFYGPDPCPCWHPSDFLCCAVCNDICAGISNFFGSCCSEVWNVLTCGECCGACSEGRCDCGDCFGCDCECGDCSGCDCDCGDC